jgi:nitroimidazol reductase NimA-like FMN-containing flavoprotein (pyridoxamine 5'-phosphate oxidase superfamily)
MPRPSKPSEITGKRRLVELSRSDCLDLLQANDFGRVVLTTDLDRTPVIRPVNYRFDVASQCVVFRTGAGTKFHALAHAANAWFEIDSIDRQTRTGWSVIIAGVTEEVTQPLEIERLDQFGPTPWAPGEHPHWIRVKARTVAGRRISLEG